MPRLTVLMLSACGFVANYGWASSVLEEGQPSDRPAAQPNRLVYDIPTLQAIGAAMRDASEGRLEQEIEIAFAENEGGKLLKKASSGITLISLQPSTRAE